VLIDLKRYGSARPELEQVVRQAPDNLLARKLLAEALAGDNDVRGALLALRALILLHPDDQESAQRIHDLEAEAGREAAEGMETLPAAAPAPAASGPAPPAAEEVAEATVAFRYEPPPSMESEVEEPAAEAEGEEESRPEASAATVLMAVPIFSSPEASPAESSMTISEEPAREEAPALEAAPSPPMKEEDEPTLGALPTPTLAEIYLAQGMADRALEIYKQVLAGDPQNHEALARIRELSARLSPSGSLTQRKIQVLEGWLERIRRHHDVQDDAGRSGPTSAGM
jgi:tetratricopeptide (TPR) repeat protein